MHPLLGTSGWFNLHIHICMYVWSIFITNIPIIAGSSLNDHLATIIVGVVQLASNSISLLLVDRVGRKPLLMASGTITSIAMAAMGISFYIDLKQHPALG